MNDYWMYLLISSLTIASPGPGVVCTLSNALRFGFTGALSGILGLAIGSLLIATVAATGLGVLLVSSALLFNIVKLAGAVYLVYIGARMLLGSANKALELDLAKRGSGSVFVEAMLIQLLNPKAILFFLSVFPQFIDYTTNTLPRFSLLIVSYGLTIVLIHSFYTLLANSVRRFLITQSGERLARRIAGSSYILFGAGLASTSR